MAGEAPVAGREGRSERPGRVVESSVQQNTDGQGALENPENTTGVPVSADRAETTHHPVGRKNRKPVFSAPKESTTTSGKERRGEPHSSPVSGEVSAALPETLQKRLDSAQENGSDVEKATVKDLNRLVSRALEQQVSLDKEWTRYESVEVERLRLLDNRGDSRLLVDTHRHNLREARAEFYTHWNHLDQAAYLLQLQLSNMDIGRLHARTTIGALTPAQQGNGASESVSTGFVGERNAGDDRKAAVEGRTLGVRIDGEMQGDAAVTGGKAWMTFVHPTELLVFASRVQQLLTEQAHLTEFLQSLTVLQNHRLVQLQKMASDQPPRQGKKEPGSLRPSHIKKSRPQRVPRRTSARGQFAPADTLDTEPWHANTDVATLGGSIVFSAAKLGTDPHVHSFPLQRPAVEAAPAHSLHDGAAKEPTTSQPQSRQPKKGKRAVVGGFEVHDDPQETVTSALLRFLSNTLTPADVNGLVPGAAGRRTQGVGGLAEATGRGRMEWITDSTVFADRTLNEVLEDEMRERAFRPAPEHRGENWGSTRLGHKHGSPEEIASSAVLVAVQFADHAAALSVYYDRVEHEGEAKAKMKPEVGVPQEIVFQYAFDNVPLEHKRYLWKEYLQIQLDDRGYEIILPEEPPQEHGDAAETKGPSDFDAGRAHRFDEPPSDEVNFSREDSKTHESLSLSEADETTPPGENVTEDVDAHPRLMLNELLQRLMDEDRENGTRQENSHGIRALKMELPGLSAEELGNLAGIGGEEGSLFPYVKDELDSKSKLADFLIAHAGLGGGDRSLFREQSWKSEDSLHYDDSELDTLRDENGDDDAVFDWLWDLDFIVI
ncbi:hypothetical protein BESB_016500 [Besnoitia besnoiti]|uniref:Uncharacterized protein n=1 Tax=Besnoitia besnoiti TaxID=94643 RepID=A0A2A9MAB7_BESBE|nr:hypothetical protein BESB_016500 [Besnoitia besnoiti]PFH32332.1 hypothetical protein BESB_016500 [Besnoitia besnoiti]